MTARWVVDEVATKRNLNITWQPISLLFKNNPSKDQQYYSAMKTTHDMLRVMEAVREAKGDAPVFDLYWELGTRIHNDGDLGFDVADALEAVGLDRAFAEAGDDEAWDEIVRKRMQQGLELVGEDVGTPIIAWDRFDGERMALFGPVITKAPTGDDALKLWDAMIDLGDIDGFWELKRTRTQRPDFGDRPS